MHNQSTGLANHGGILGMKYEVQTVADGALPEGFERVIVERDDAPPLLILSGEAARCWQFMRAWEDTREPEWQPSVCLPLLRLVV